MGQRKEKGKIEGKKMRAIRKNRANIGKWAHDKEVDVKERELRDEQERWKKGREGKEEIEKK
jgi:hypothetical protein